MEAQVTPTQYPVRLSIDYPDRDLNSATTFFRIIVVIPILIVLGLLSVTTWGAEWDKGEFAYAAGGLLFLPTLLLIVFRQKYPGWWFDWNLNLLRVETRVFAYLSLVDDRYRSTDAEQYVHLDIDFRTRRATSIGGSRS